MKREFLEGLDLGNGVKLPKEAIDAIMAEHGKTVNPLKEQITTLTTDRDAWQARAGTAEEIIQQIPKDQDPAKLMEALNEAKTALETAEADYNKKLAERDFNDALRTAMGDYKFTSPGAQRDVERQIREAGLPVKDGRILGLQEFVADLRGKDPAAFVDEEAETKEANKAKFTQRTTTGGKDKKPMTRDEIMAIPDRAARRAAIAENMELFDKK